MEAHLSVCQSRSYRREIFSCLLVARCRCCGGGLTRRFASSARRSQPSSAHHSLFCLGGSTLFRGGLRLGRDSLSGITTHYLSPLVTLAHFRFHFRFGIYLRGSGSSSSSSSLTSLAKSFGPPVPLRAMLLDLRHARAPGRSKHGSEASNLPDHSVANLGAAALADIPGDCVAHSQPLLCC